MRLEGGFTSATLLADAVTVFLFVAGFWLLRTILRDDTPVPHARGL